MITCLLILARVLTIIARNGTKSPIKLCALLILSSRLNFLNLSIFTGIRIISLIFIIIFLGGIILIFIILCSILPNRVSRVKKDKKALLFIFLTISRLMVISTPKNPQNTYPMLKWFLESGNNTLIVTLIILLYFTLFNKTINDKQGRIRTLEC